MWRFITENIGKRRFYSRVNLSHRIAHEVTSIVPNFQQDSEGSIDDPQQCPSHPLVEGFMGPLPSVQYFFSLNQPSFSSKVLFAA